MSTRGTVGLRNTVGATVINHNINVIVITSYNNAYSVDFDVCTLVCYNTTNNTHNVCCTYNAPSRDKRQEPGNRSVHRSTRLKSCRPIRTGRTPKRAVASASWSVRDNDRVETEPRVQQVTANRTRVGNREHTPVAKHSFAPASECVCVFVRAREVRTSVSLTFDVVRA